MRKRCALLTCADLDGYVVDDRLLLPHLARAGWEARDVAWDDPKTDWSGFSCAVIRSTWDYPEKVDAFLAAMDRIEQAGVKLFNPAKLVRWNARKTYMLELEKKGVPIVPTEIVLGFDKGALDRAFQKSGTVCIKPTVSANARKTFVLRREDVEARRAELEGPLAGVEVMVQPFLESIRGGGEDSLFYFGGAYSHAVRKVPKSGDFRVQEEHGGVITPLKPDAELLALSAELLKAVGKPLLYARADWVRDDDGKALLMELELIEPALYFRMDENSPAAFVKAFLSFC